ncbi:MAG: ComF family protein [Bacteroidales bacterium]
MLKKLGGGLLHLIYPRTCAACGNILLNNEKVLCLSCYAELPRTRFHNNPENEVARLFWGRVLLRNATSFIFFNKDSNYRKILHELKYKDQRQVGHEMGRLFGLELRDTPFSQADMIIPVPLHPAKQRKRGYNQSELIAEGVSQVLSIPVRNNLISRKMKTATQTRKNRFDRWLNVKDTFQVQDIAALNDNHILLVDDVITTGATIEACAGSILANCQVSLSVISLAYTKLQ